MSLKKEFFRLGLMAVIMAGLTSMAFAKDKFELEFEKDQEAVKLVRDTKLGGYEIMSTEELKKLIDSRKDVLIVDTMPYDDSYKKEHIPGAKQFLFPIHIMEQWDAKETGGKTPQDLSALLGGDKEKIIVFYCGFVKCTRSHNGAAWAKKLGYTKVYRYPGGIFVWKGAGYKTEKAQRPANSEFFPEPLCVPPRTTLRETESGPPAASVSRRLLLRFHASRLVVSRRSSVVSNTTTVARLLAPDH